MIERKKVTASEFILILKGENADYLGKWQYLPAIRVENVKLDEEVFLKEDFESHYPILLIDIEFNNRFVFDGCIIKHDIMIYENVKGSTKEAFIAVWKGSFAKEFFIGTPDIHFIVAGGDFNILSHWGSGNRLQIANSFANITINKLELQNLIKSEIKIDLINEKKYIFEIDQLILSSVNRNAIISISNISIMKIVFSYSVVLGNLYLIGINNTRKNRGELQIYNSDLGKTQFINCDFSNFDLNSSNSKLSEVFIAGTTLPKMNHINSNDARQKRLIFSQLKKSYEVQGDYLSALTYKTAEINSYYNTLKWNINGWEKFNLLLNKLSNNHGESWRQSVVSTLIVSAFFYIIYLYLLGFRIGEDYELFRRSLLLFLEFLNPLHKPDYIPNKVGMKEIDIPHIALGWENLSRIFIGFFIYQFIQAFRKHGR